MKADYFDGKDKSLIAIIMMISVPSRKKKTPDFFIRFFIP